MRTIQENNTLIAAFMGMPHATYDQKSGYNKSWDKLMPVIERIETLGFNVKIHSDYTSINKIKGKCIGDIVGNSKIENTYAAVIGFINALNEKKL